MGSPYAERQARNEESRNRADNHAQRWTLEEYDFLRSQWNTRSEEDLALIAELLGRTVEACRQRYYNVDARVAFRRERRSSATAAPYIGHYDNPEDVYWT